MLLMKNIMIVSCKLFQEMLTLLLPDIMRIVRKSLCICRMETVPAKYSMPGFIATVKQRVHSAGSFLLCEIVIRCFLVYLFSFCVPTPNLLFF